MRPSCVCVILSPRSRCPFLSALEVATKTNAIRTPKRKKESEEGKGQRRRSVLFLLDA